MGGVKVVVQSISMKSGEGREVESGGVILPTPVFDMCRGPGQLPTPGQLITKISESFCLLTPSDFAIDRSIAADCRIFCHHVMKVEHLPGEAR